MNNVSRNMINTVKEESDKNKEKELKKLLESYLAVAKHKLGRTPTMEDLHEMLSLGKEEKQQEDMTLNELAAQERDSDTSNLEKDENGVKSEMSDVASPEDPRILHLKVYYGMNNQKDGSKIPDESKILFYEDPIDKEYYDCSTKEWSNDRPAILDHLNSRLINNDERDVLHSILHGVMDEDSFNSLNDKGMVNDLHKNLWGLVKKLDSQYKEMHESLNKSDDDGFEDELQDDDIIYNFEDELQDGLDIDNLQLENQAGEFEGDDVLSELINAAVSSAIINNESRIREIVREELAKIK